MKLLIITADPGTLHWQSLPTKLAAIKTALDGCKGDTWTVDIEHRALQPVVVNGRISHDWYNTISHEAFRRGYHHIYLHFSMAQWELLGLDKGIRGANQKDTDFVGESYGRGDESTKRGTTKLNQFIQNVLHEMSHELHRACGMTDQTHAYHDASADITGIFPTIDLAKWQPVLVAGLKVQVSLLTRLKDLLTRKEPTSLFHPVQFKPRIVSQAYGVPDASSYPRTGIHIGTDYAVPVGTPLYAPWDGEVIAVGTGAEIGHFLHFRYVFQGETIVEQWGHLRDVPKVGVFKRAARLAYSGNTGKSTGPHLHRAGHRKLVEVGSLTPQNVHERTIDLETLTYEQ
jgi:hypothetical protein